MIGIQAYFPLVDHDEPPTPQELEAGWADVVADLEAYSRVQGRKIVLGELGYNHSMHAAVRPWSYQQDSDPRAGDLQEECLAVALAAVDQSPSIVGAFLWKWFPGEFPRGNFLKSTPRMRAVIADRWGGSARPQPLRQP